MIPGLQTFSTLQVAGAMNQLQDVRELPGELLLTRRIRMVPANQGEIMARFVGRAVIADIIAEDAKAVTYGYGKMDFVNYEIPTIKHGAKFNKSDMNQLINLSGYALKGDQGAIRELKMTRNAVLDNLLLGVRWRVEALLWAMYTDGIHYDKLGMKIDSTWGMPAEQKITVAVAWTDASNATPVDDLLTAKLSATERLGIMYDRVTMSTQAFRYMIATTNFQTRAKLVIPPQVTFASYSQQQIEPMRIMAEQVIGMKIELYDRRYWNESEDGTRSSYRFMPINKVYLDDSSNDNNPMIMDLGNMVPLESRVAGMAGTPQTGGGDIGMGQPGPFAYSFMSPDLNPPTLTMYAVMNCWPRKWTRQANAVLTVGNFTDTISVGEPF